jgi:8-amino-7-oxononanoate synthase
MLNQINPNLTTKLQQRADAQQLRQLNILNGVDFYSNDYLGMGQLESDYPMISDKKNGATGSRLISGQSMEVDFLEDYLAQYYLAPSALLFNSGYTANLALFSCLPQRHDVVLFDELIHASIRDGLRLSLCKHQHFKHNDYAHLEALLQKHQAADNIYVALESIYSMDGDSPDFAQILALQQQYHFQLIIDEAHGTGILGPDLKGAYQNYPPELILARVHTFGKALGSHGAVIVGEPELKKYLVNFARPFIYTTGPSYGMINEILHAHLKFEAHKHQQYTRLQQNIQHYAQRMGSEKANLQSPIQLFFSPDLKALEQKLILNKFMVKAIYSPTVAPGTERLRLILHSYNTPKQIDLLCQALIN